MKPRRLRKEVTVMCKGIGKWPRIFLVMTLMTIGAASAARAEERIVAKVPFSFIVQGVRLPAGSYTVTENAMDLGGVCLIASDDGRQAVYVMTTAASADRPADKPVLLFEKFGDQYFLSRVVPADGDEREIVLTPSIMEHELAEVAENP
jgi:hypothetical protein